MPPRTLASLAHALGAAPDVGAALVALSEALAELDRGASVALLTYDERRGLLAERLLPLGGHTDRAPLDASMEHLPTQLRLGIMSGGRFVDLADRSSEVSRLFTLTLPAEGTLSLRGVRVEGYLPAVLALTEPRKIFGARVLDRFAPAVSLFELAFARLWEREAREEAVHTLEEVTQRVHAEYVRKLGALERQLADVRATPAVGMPAIAPPPVAMEMAATQQAEAVRRAERRAEMLEQQISSSAAQLEQTQLELHRRGETLRQTSRTLYLIDRVLSLDAAANDPRQLVDGLLALVGDDMQAQRCSLMLRAPEPNHLYLAAARGIAPHVMDGARVRFGEGVAGRVAQSRVPLLVRDVRDAGTHPLLHDQYFTTGSFISFPLVYHGELVGVVNLTNKANASAYTDEDVERVRLLGLVIALIATHAQLPERLLDVIAVA
ncbi:GAF domain protein [Gemmatirosa kalamazoonensis]|uniref:GAF domain protein n=1 Tax=Gemmatirosa kalamazoonensis TaxID=861299 RepID=W0RKQ6_9BACT|nr:GAF domain-containing protein [Gemmatirosa kalamazoonensis]AHG90905.1 GAF domain protein [Gemmatirosa kalamazoonensis]